jgi:NACHT domain
MDPITSSIISGLVSRVLGGAAGSIPRLVKSRRQKLVREAVGDLNARAQSFLVPALAGLAERGDSTQEAVSTFLGSLEAETYVRSVAGAVMSGQLKNVPVNLLDQLVALLILVAGVQREAAQDLANFLFSLFVRTIEAAAERLKRTNKTLYVSVSDRALSELRAGSLDGLVQRSRLLRRRDPAELADFLSFADRYRELLHDRTSELVPAYFDVQRRVPISRLYVTPRFAIREGPSDRPHERSPVPLDAILEWSYRMVILGDPGAGKSTLAQHLAHFYSDQGRFGANEFGIVPFVVSLRTYEEWKNSAHGSVVDFLTSNILENFQLEAPHGAIEYLLLTGRAFVLFDGLDELINVAKRQAVCDVIANFSDLYATATVLVTSRKVGYFEAPINPQRFTTATLMNFSDEDVVAYVANWFAVDDRLDRRTRETMVRSFLDESKSVRDIRSNALMLGLMCNLYRGVRTIPQNRVDLYEKCAEMLFERWDASRGITTSNVLKADAKAALQDIALWMYTTPGLTNGVTEKQLNSRLTVFWSKRFEDHGRAAEVARELLSLWKGRTWVLTDVGSIGTNRKLVYKFTHQTFLEFFAAVEVVRRNPAPRTLWDTLVEPISQGSWEIVAQLAIQKLDEFYLDGADQVLVLLIDEASERGIAAQCNLLSFAARNLENLYAKPATQRRLVSAAVDLGLLTMPAVSPITTSREYLDLADQNLQSLVRWHADTHGDGGILPADGDRRINQRDLWQPILLLLATTDELQRLTVDQLLGHGAALLDADDPEIASKAFVFLLSRLSFSQLGLFLGTSFQDELTIDIPASLWNTVELERKLGHRISVDMNRQWGACNFWAAILACREQLFPVTDMIRSAGAATVTCSADPFFDLGTSLAQDLSLAEELLVSYLDCADSRDEKCRFSAGAASSVLEVVGQKLTTEVTRFDGFWLPATSLYDRVVKREFLSGRVGSSGAGVDFSPTFSNPDAAFGAAVLLAAIVELEKWEVVDYSDDQLGSLALGPLQPLETLYIARRTEGYWGVEIEQAIDRVNLSDRQKHTLSDWARKRIHFIV